MKPEPTPDRATELAQLLEKHALNDLIPDGMICPLLDAAKTLRRLAQVEAAAGEYKACADSLGYVLQDISRSCSREGFEEDAPDTLAWIETQADQAIEHYTKRAAAMSTQPTPGKAGA